MRLILVITIALISFNRCFAQDESNWTWIPHVGGGFAMPFNQKAREGIDYENGLGQRIASDIGIEFERTRFRHLSASFGFDVGHLYLGGDYESRMTFVNHDQFYYYPHLKSCVYYNLYFKLKYNFTPHMTIYAGLGFWNRAHERGTFNATSLGQSECGAICTSGSLSFGCTYKLKRIHLSLDYSIIPVGTGDYDNRDLNYMTLKVGFPIKPLIKTKSFIYKLKHKKDGDHSQQR